MARNSVIGNNLRRPSSREHFKEKYFFSQKFIDVLSQFMDMSDKCYPIKVEGAEEQYYVIYNLDKYPYLNEKRASFDEEPSFYCGKEISKGSTRCRECNDKLQVIPIEKLPVTREELKMLIRTKPFTTIGQQFNCTDNAIRKWCDKFNLPKRKKDINNYNNEE